MGGDRSGVRPATRFPPTSSTARSPVPVTNIERSTEILARECASLSPARRWQSLKRAGYYCATLVADDEAGARRPAQTRSPTNLAAGACSARASSPRRHRTDQPGPRRVAPQGRARTLRRTGRSDAARRPTRAPRRVSPAMERFDIEMAPGPRRRRLSWTAPMRRLHRRRVARSRPHDGAFRFVRGDRGACLQPTRTLRVSWANSPGAPPPLPL